MKSESPAIDLQATLENGLGGASLHRQETRDAVPTFWVPAEKNLNALRLLKEVTEPRFEMLFDLTAIDERKREHRDGTEPCSFSVVYHLLSFSGKQMVRIKVPLEEEFPHL